MSLTLFFLSKGRKKAWFYKTKGSQSIAVFLSRGVYCHYKISPRDSCIVAQIAFTSFYRSQSREMGTMLREYLESVTN